MLYLETTPSNIFKFPSSALMFGCESDFEECLPHSSFFLSVYILIHLRISLPHPSPHPQEKRTHQCVSSWSTHGLHRKDAPFVFLQNSCGVQRITIRDVTYPDITSMSLRSECPSLLVQYPAVEGPGYLTSFPLMRRTNSSICFP